MPSKATIYGVLAYEDAGVALMARVKGNDAANITQAGLSGITYAVYEKSTRTQVVASTALTVSAVVFDALQTDARWTVDSTGYNFRHGLPATALPDGGKTYRVEYVFTPTSGEVFVLVFEVSTVELIRS